MVFSIPAGKDFNKHSLENSSWIYDERLYYYQ